MRGVKSDLTGKRFGKLYVVMQGESRGYRTYWICQCACGNTSSVRGSHLVAGSVVSCGKCQLDLIGKIYGDYAVVAYAGKKRNKDNYWYIKCSCGNQKKIRQDFLLNGNLPLCKCKKPVKVLVKRIPHPLLKIWYGMKERCYNTKNSRYKDYGKRGIIVCDRWLGSFEKFVHDMGERPAGYAIDRINNDGNYCPENCRWTSVMENNRNKRNNVHLWFNSKRYTLSELSGCVSLSISSCSFRLRNEWPTTSAIFFPVKSGISYPEVGNFMRQKRELNTYAF